MEILSFSHFATPLPSDSHHPNWGSEIQDVIAVAIEKAARRGVDGERGITFSFSSSESEKLKIPFSLQKIH